MFWQSYPRRNPLDIMEFASMSQVIFALCWHAYWLMLVTDITERERERERARERKNLEEGMTSLVKGRERQREREREIDPPQQTVTVLAYVHKRADRTRVFRSRVQHRIVWTKWIPDACASRRNAPRTRDRDYSSAIYYSTNINHTHTVSLWHSIGSRRMTKPKVVSWDCS